MLKFLLFYFIFINVVGIISMGYDKRKAIRREWRVPEANLFFIALIFGSIGSIIGMHMFHHKTKHLKFTIGMPIILLVQIVVLYKLRLIL